MKKVFAGLLLLAAAMRPAWADGYSNFNAGIAAFTDHNTTGAIRFITQALSAPDLPAHLRPTAFRVRAQAYVLSKQYDLAIADYGSALALRPANYDALIERGSIYGDQKKYDLARTDFTAAIRVRPELGWAYISEAAADLAEEKYDAAIRDYNDALATSPENIDLFLLRGEANRLARRYADAITDFGTAIHKDSRYTAAYDLRAFAHLEAGDLQEAVSDYEEAVDLDPDDLGLRESAGIAQWDNGDYRSAARSFERSATDPKDPKRVVYSELWLHLATTKRGRSDDDLVARAARLDLKTWPRPLLSLFAGTVAAGDVFAAAKQGDADEQKDQLCEANFFVAEWHLGQKDNAAAKPLLEEAASSCRRGLPYSYAARLELKRLTP